MAEAAEQGKELEAFPSAEEQGQAGKADNAADNDLHSLERRKDRTLYLLAKKKRSEHAWQFRTFSVHSFPQIADAHTSDVHNSPLPRRVSQRKEASRARSRSCRLHCGS